ncbi:hypothetical protein Bbelb_300830 [Branchiostoma belcheri]|nr:hypothetical protein Bbelb_300830 [Branchiostoma belcheri]
MTHASKLTSSARVFAIDTCSSILLKEMAASYPRVTRGRSFTPQESFRTSRQHVSTPPRGEVKIKATPSELARGHVLPIPADKNANQGQGAETCSLNADHIRRDLIVRTPRGTPPVAGIPPGHISYVTDQMNRIKPMPARLLNPAGASRGYIPDGHRCKLGP